MTAPPKYHVREQRADALLSPVATTLRELEGRVRHYLDRVLIAPGDDEALRAAARALAAARHEVETLAATARTRPQA